MQVIAPVDVALKHTSILGACRQAFPGSACRDVIHILPRSEITALTCPCCYMKVLCLGLLNSLSPRLHVQHGCFHIVCMTWRILSIITVRQLPAS